MLFSLYLTLPSPSFFQTSIIDTGIGFTTGGNNKEKCMSFMERAKNTATAADAASTTTSAAAADTTTQPTDTSLPPVAGGAGDGGASSSGGKYTQIYSTLILDVLHISRLLLPPHKVLQIVPYKL